MFRLFLAALALALATATSTFAQAKKLTITVMADGKEDAKDVPVVVPMDVPANLAKGAYVSLKQEAGTEMLIGQWTAPDLVTESIKAKDPALVRRDLHFIAPKLKAGTVLKFSVEPLARAANSQDFHWTDKKGEYAELWRGEKPIMRYMYRAYDNSSTENRDKTYKVFHHLFDPTGKTLVTNGGQTDPPSDVKLLFPHHRGLMYAFNKVTYDNGKPITDDVWHAKPGDTHESHKSFLDVEAGPVLGRHRVAIDWHGRDNKVIAKEQREMTVYAVDGGTLLEFASLLKTAGGKVRLDGDPQHAGFHFRAANAVSEKSNLKKTYYLRPDGKGKPGETRNWDPKKKEGPINLPWDAMSFVLDGKRYTVAYIDSPKNPGEKRYSERDYGRFGCYFEYELTPEHPLLLNHRIWLQNGEMTGPQVEALVREFVAPPKVTVN